MTVKYKVEITQTAERDIEEIWTYISSDNPSRAGDFLTALEEQIFSLESFPERCPLIPENELLGTGYRHLIHGNYRTFIRIASKKVYILKIIHSSRLFDASIFADP